ncbi:MULTISPECIES: ATP-binding protein [unclassified Streptomyces]|uniref:ATP-binding protein n=1 Tax=unclassified Streptomyces TaxID=2593676 RepID=UPI002E2DB8C6|nr:ATP-binding protein [Streptomyces sp. NBC_00223]
MAASVTTHPEPLVVMRWASEPLSVGRARSSLRRVLERWELNTLVAPAELVLSELFTNAIQHVDAEVADRLVETRFAREAGGVRIEVHDAGDRMPVRHKAGEDEESGRGLFLVAAVVGPDGWGVSEREGVGKRVWARVTVACCGEAGAGVQV